MYCILWYLHAWLSAQDKDAHARAGLERAAQSRRKAFLTKSRKKAATPPRARWRRRGTTAAARAAP